MKESTLKNFSKLLTDPGLKLACLRKKTFLCFKEEQTRLETGALVAVKIGQ